MIWDKLSPFYDFFETAYNGKCYKGIAEKIKEYVTEDDVVLECACGTGLLTLPMAQTCKKLIATDYSVGMLRHDGYQKQYRPLYTQMRGTGSDHRRSFHAALAWQNGIPSCR